MSEFLDRARGLAVSTKEHAAPLGVGAAAVALTAVAPELAPFILGAGGAGAGALDGKKVHGKIADQRQNLVQALGEQDARDLIGDPENATTSDRRRFLTSPVVGSLALVYGAVGALAGAAVQSNEAPRTVPPRIQYVAAMPGTMGPERDAKSPLGRVINVSKLLAGKDKEGAVKAKAVVARASQTPPVSITQVASMSALGEAPMSQAVSTAFNNIRTEQAKVEAGGKSNAAVIVATYGEGIGAENRVIAEANGSDVRTPVYVLDLGENTSRARQRNYEAIATQTGGRYFEEMGQNDVNKIVDNLQQAEIKTGEGGSDLGLKVLALSLLVAASSFRRRVVGYLPLRYHGERKEYKEIKGE